MFWKTGFPPGQPEPALPAQAQAMCPVAREGWLVGSGGRVRVPASTLSMLPDTGKYLVKVR